MNHPLSLLPGTARGRTPRPENRLKPGRQRLSGSLTAEDERVVAETVIDEPDQHPWRERFAAGIYREWDDGDFSV